MLIDGPALLEEVLCGRCEYGGGLCDEYCWGGPLDILPKVIDVDTLTVPVGGAELELKGWTSSQGLARRAMGVQDRCGSMGPINLART